MSEREARARNKGSSELTFLSPITASFLLKSIREMISSETTDFDLANKLTFRVKMAYLRTEQPQ